MKAYFRETKHTLGTGGLEEAIAHHAVILLLSVVYVFSTDYLKGWLKLKIRIILA